MSCVLFEEHTTQDGHVIGEITLNAERSLNALTLEMIEEILPRLNQWQSDERVVAVLLDSAGEKSFCAGGDVVNLYKAIQGDGAADFPERFFENEYRLDYQLHTFPKPVICWGNGIVMGGGMGPGGDGAHRRRRPQRRFRFRGGCQERGHQLRPQRGQNGLEQPAHPHDHL